MNLCNLQKPRMLRAAIARENLIKEETKCLDCNPWRRAVEDDVQQASCRSLQVNLRGDHYTDPGFDSCLPTIKNYLRGEGFYVWKEEYVPKDASHAQDEDWQSWVTVDWSNSWTGWWRDTKDRWGFLGVYKESN